MGIRFMPKYGKQALQASMAVSVFRRRRARSLGRRARPHRSALQARARPRREDPVFYTRAALDLIARRQRRARRARAHRRQDASRSAAKASCSPAAASRPMRKCARATSAPAGTSPRCAARASTRATASRMALDIGAMPYGNWSGCHICRLGHQHARTTATSRSATRSRNTAICSASWSTPTASASSTKAPTSA